MKRALPVCFVVVASSAAAATAQTARYEYPFQDPDRPAEARITDLVSRMTLDEKVDCLATRASVPRLGVKGSPHIEGSTSSTATSRR